MKNLIIAALVAALAIVGGLAYAGSVDTTADVDVTVWKHADTGGIYLSTRPAGGSWTTHNTPVDLSNLHSQYPSWYQGSAITVSVPVTVDVPDVGEQPPAEDSEVVSSAGWIYVSSECDIVNDTVANFPSEQQGPCYAPGLTFTLEAGLWRAESFTFGSGTHCALWAHAPGGALEELRQLDGQGAVYATFEVGDTFTSLPPGLI